MAKRLKPKKNEWGGLTAHIENVSINTVQPHPKNPRLHDERNIQSIMSSLDEFELMAPMIVWGPKNYVIVGNGRLEACIRLGKGDIDIVRADHLTEDQAIAYMIADNKTGDLSEFDFEAVASLFKELETKEYSLEKTGFAQYETEPLLQGSWTPPAVKPLEDVGDDVNIETNVLSFTDEQMQVINKAVAKVKMYEGFEDVSTVNGILEICGEYIE